MGDTRRELLLLWAAFEGEPQLARAKRYSVACPPAQVIRVGLRARAPGVFYVDDPVDWLLIRLRRCAR